MLTFPAEVASTASYELAVGPVSDAGRERLLWVDMVAVWGAGQVRNIAAAGEHVATVEVAAPHTSSGPTAAWSGRCAHITQQEWEV